MRTALIKLSGELLGGGTITATVVRVLKKVPKDVQLTVCWSGGQQVEEAIIAGNGHSRKVIEIGSSGRILREKKELQRAIEVLSEGSNRFREVLARAGIEAKVVIPVIKVVDSIDSSLCLVNGDAYVLACYRGFDCIVVMTSMALGPQKKEFFEKNDPLDKIEVIGFTLGDDSA